MSRRWVWVLGAACFLVLGFAVGQSRLRFNWSDSIPGGLYAWEQKELSRGAVVEVCAGTFWKTASERRYLPHGHCPGMQSAIVKVVAGLPGDAVTVTQHEVLVNGEPLRSSNALRADSEGRPVRFFGEGVIVLGPDEIWLAGTSPRAIDSRILGPVPLSQARCCLSPVWTRGPVEVFR